MPCFVGTLIGLLLGYQKLVAMLFVGETRYRAPWDYLLALLAGATIAELLRRRSQIRLFRGRERISGDIPA